MRWRDSSERRRKIAMQCWSKSRFGFSNSLRCIAPKIDRLLAVTIKAFEVDFKGIITYTHLLYIGSSVASHKDACLGTEDCVFESPWHLGVFVRCNGSSCRCSWCIQPSILGSCSPGCLHASLGSLLGGCVQQVYHLAPGVVRLIKDPTPDYHLVYK